MFWLILLYLTIYVIVCTIFGSITQGIINNKGYDEKYWFWLGFFFGGIAIIAAALKPQMTYQSSSYRSYNSIQERSDNTIGRPASALNGRRDDGWQCTCGQWNPSYTGTCKCGVLKTSVTKYKTETARLRAEERKKERERQRRTDEIQKRRQEQEAAKAQTISEQEKVKLLKEYKELLDSGIISEEEFNAKKASLLKEKNEN